MNAQEEILNLINRYSFTIDTGDLDGYAELFANGELTTEGIASFSGKEQCLESLSNVIIYEDGTPRTKHVTSNVNIKIDEETRTASSQCYVTIFQQTTTFPMQSIFSGHYFDTFENIDGAWRFKKRLIKNLLVGDMSSHLKHLG